MCGDPSGERWWEEHLQSFHSYSLISANPVSLSFDSFPSFLCLDNIIFLSVTTFAVCSKWWENLLLCSSHHDLASPILLPSHSLVHALRLLLNWIHMFCSKSTLLASQRSVMRVKPLMYIKCSKIPSPKMLDLDHR